MKGSGLTNKDRWMDQEDQHGHSTGPQKVQNVTVEIRKTKIEPYTTVQKFGAN
jgi:hypothetical protein